MTSNNVEITNIVQDLKSHLINENEQFRFKLAELEKRNNDLSTSCTTNMSQILEEGKDIPSCREICDELTKISVASYTALNDGCTLVAVTIEKHKDKYRKLKANVSQDLKKFTLFDEFTVMNYHDVEAQKDNLQALTLAAKNDIIKLAEEHAVSGDMQTAVDLLQAEVDEIASYEKESRLVLR